MRLQESSLSTTDRSMFLVALDLQIFPVAIKLIAVLVVHVLIFLQLPLEHRFGYQRMNSNVPVRA